MGETTIITKCNRYIGYLFAFSLSSFVRATPAIIAVWILCLIVDAVQKRKVEINFSPSSAFIFVLYFMYVLGLLWSDNQVAARFALEEKFSLFLFPLLIAFNTPFFKQNYKGILFAFVLGALASSIFCLAYATWESIYIVPGGIGFNSIDPEYANWEFGGSRFRYINLSIFMHPTYFSIYILFAIALLFQFLKDSPNLDKKTSILLKLSIPFFMLMLYLLSSKAVLLSALVLVIVYSVVQYRKQNGLLIKALIAFSVIVFVFIALQNPRIELMIDNLNKPELFSDNLQDGSLFSRLHIWNAGTDIVKKHFFLGVGPGDTSSELLNRYIAHHYIDPVLRNSNAHNQYLETFIDLGFFGFLLLFISIIFPIFEPIDKRNTVFLVFLFIVGFNFLFESVLNMQTGVVFFSFFYSLFSILEKKDKLRISR